MSGRAPAPPSTPPFNPTSVRAAAAQDLIRRLRMDHRELRDERINKTKGMVIFGLAAKDLQGLPVRKEPNPYRPDWGKHLMYEVRLLAEACLNKYGSLEGLKEKKAKNKAAAAKRQATREGRAEAMEAESEGPLVQELRVALGLKGVPEINKTWARDLFRLTDKDLKAIPYKEVPNHSSEWRDQKMYEVLALAQACVNKYGSLAGLKEKKEKKPTKTQKSFYAPYVPPPAEVRWPSHSCAWSFMGGCCCE